MAHPQMLWANYVLSNHPSFSISVGAAKNGINCGINKNLPLSNLSL